MTAQFRKRVLWQRRAFRRAQIFEPFGKLAHGRAQSAKAEAGKYRLDLVDNPRLLSDQILALTVRSPRVLLLVGIATMLQWRFSPRSQPRKTRIRSSVSRRSVFARRCSRDTAMLVGWMT